jgi:serine O-acetyltransferase
MIYVFTRRLLASIQSYQKYADGGGFVNRALRRFARIRHAFWSVLTSSDIAISAKIPYDLSLPHPNGVIIHEDAIIGAGCMIMQQVTIGMIDTGDVPQIGDNVYIGAGAKVLGRVYIGNGAKIGAMAVVLQNVPENCTAVGIPAKIIAAGSSR